MCTWRSSKCTNGSMQTGHKRTSSPLLFCGGEGGLNALDGELEGLLYQLGCFGSSHSTTWTGKSIYYQFLAYEKTHLFFECIYCILHTSLFDFHIFFHVLGFPQTAFVVRNIDILWFSKAYYNKLTLLRTLGQSLALWEANSLLSIEVPHSQTTCLWNSLTCSSFLILWTTIWQTSQYLYH